MGPAGMVINSYGSFPHNIQQLLIIIPATPIPYEESTGTFTAWMTDILMLGE